MTTAPSGLHASNLRKSYHNRLIVADISLHVKPGEIVGLLGPNGAGKTTCFYMLVGLVSADAGAVTLNEHTLTHLPMAKRARLGLGYLPQEASVFRKMTVADNIASILEIRPDLDRQARQEKLAQLLNEFHLESIRASRGLSLSGGERRRVEIARALAANPAFILLDEPFAGVDPISIGDIKVIINQLSERGIGVLITDHNVRETLDICQRAYIVGSGQVIASGSAADILAHPQVRETYLGTEFKL